MSSRRSDRAPARARILFTLAAGGLVFAAVPAVTRAAPSREEQAATVVRRMVDRYQAMNAFEQEAKHTMRMDGGGRRDSRMVPVRFVYRSPNRFLYRVSDPQGGGVTLASDGDLLWVYSRAKNQYTVRGAASDMASVRGAVGQWGMTYMDAFAFLQGADPFAGVRSIRSVGSAVLRGVPVDMIELRGTPPELQLPQSTTRLYIGKKDRLLYQSVTHSGILSPPSSPVPGSQPVRMSMTMTKTYSAMKVNRPGPSHVFLFKPPAGAREVSSL